ncbi:Anthranilate phosphoribosyltransferase [Buchnera aphidicola (Eriosoma lanigerum)]|uniref:anthranilate phosphoribosyltransferase n=1 Tax=Buchnera aphidicola TaxID=9 RepID=UPI00346488FF
MNKILKKLYQLIPLTELESYLLFINFIEGNINDIQLSAILTAIKIRNFTPLEMVGAVKAFLDKCEKFPKPNYIFADIVGTGGDGKNTINISTISAIVAAIDGCKIIKHCNSNISSKSGSADFLKYFGIDINQSYIQSQNMLNKYNICFLLATEYHIGFKYATLVRKTLATTTLFNIIGPLLNPSKPDLIVIGVYKQQLLLPMAQTLQILNYKRAIVLHSNGTDEITIDGVTNLIEVKNNKIQSYQLTAKDFGIDYIKKNININDISFENSSENMLNLLQGSGNIIHMQTIAINVAILFKIFGYENLKENTERALSIIKSGKIYKYIKNMAEKDNYAKNCVTRNFI